MHFPLRLSFWNELVIFGKIAISQDTLLRIKTGEYHYTLAHLIFHSKDFYPYTKESILFREYDIELLSGFLEVEFSSDELGFLQKEQNLKIEKRRYGFG